MESLKNSTAYDVFNNFSLISEIPRCSHDEEKISKFIYNIGKELGYETKQDEVGNVLIIKPASEGYENHETIVLQSHVDMVCVKTEGSMHDFTCDPIELLIDGDFIKAKDTTLGADDGIGVALMLAILKDKSLSHPQIEFLFTRTEETGMDGAFGLSETALTGKNLINLDNEEDWIIIVGCAGGLGADLKLNIEFEEVPNMKQYEIKLSGLQGGHSGSMINELRLNAIKVLDSALVKLKNKINFRLKEINGGTKHNAIPSSAKSIIGIEDDNDIKEIFEEISLEIKDLYIKRELDLQFEINELENDDNKYIDEESSSKILRILSTFPHGVNTYDNDLDIVKSSNNLAIIRTTENSFTLETSLRSSDENDLENLKVEIRAQADLYGFDIEFNGGYPMWEPNFDNELLNKAKNVYRDITDKDAEVQVIHAGLETGIFSKKYPQMNMISIGPTIIGAHTPNEKISIKSTEFEFEFLKTLIKNL